MQSNSFSLLGVTPPICQALEKKQIVQPTPVQLEMIPQLLNYPEDVIALAATGTGKTAAFGVPILQFAEQDSSPCQSLVLTPTRELALQVSKEIESMASELPVKVLPLYGGRQIQPQIKALKQNSFQIIVGTPGRILDHIRSKRLKINQLRFLVLDEADEMLDIGFQDELEAILQAANPDRQTLLFSATMSSRVKKIANNYLTKPKSFDFRSENKRTTDLVYYQAPAKSKKDGLCRILETMDDFYGLVFCRRKADVDELSEFLRKKDYPAAALHGDLSSAARETVMRQFRGRQFKILVATDVAARGIDISDLNTVVNYSLPDTSEALMHRIGRTGRAGKAGLAILLITPSERGKLRRYEKDTGLQFAENHFLSGKKLAKLKQEQLRTQLITAMEKEAPKDYQELAQQLLELSSPEQLVAAFLEHVYGKSMLAEAYREMAAPEKRSKGNEDKGSSRAGRKPRGSFNRSRSKTGQKFGKKSNNAKPDNNRPQNKSRKRTKPKGTVRT
jgi:ATP-dependent RNA helicase DeaD